MKWPGIINHVVQKSLELWCYLMVVSRIDDLWKKNEVRKLRKKPQVNVVFVASFLSQWKYQPLYELMKKNPRLNPIILVAPMRHHEQSPDFIGLKKKFAAEHIEYVDFDLLSEKEKNIREFLSPDILFYIQPYYHIYDKRIDSHSFKDKLVGYTFYSFELYDHDWVYDLEFLERAWKVFYASEYHKKVASAYALNKGRNAEVVGYVNADFYAEARSRLAVVKVEDVWKKQKRSTKRIIWAPHFSITPNTKLYQGNFIKMAEDMLSVAKLYKDKVQFSFKPHPSLYSVLVRYSEWGKERTDAYYEQWAKGENTQLDSGEFIDLFMTSDAMINDSGSFTAEYIYTLKPALNCFVDTDRVFNEMNEIGKAALACQYNGSSREEVERFINDVVLDGHDILYEEREAFYEKYLKISSGESVTMKIYNSVLSAIG